MGFLSDYHTLLPKGSGTKMVSIQINGEPWHMQVKNHVWEGNQAHKLWEN